ncbi:peptidoglycan-binding LysM [Kalymmatonema gypsitolerans NIES-4073]|nr:peptidoglycan-binding LysM [Scytonema sp. NIES-4073]
MVNTQDIRFKKSGGGLVSENPLSSTHPRAANPLSLAHPHATAASTLVKPQPSAPSRAPAVSLRSGDTLWEIAQKKLGDGTRWRELQKADGSQFTGQEVKRLQVGTQVYLPGANSTHSRATTVSVRRGDTLGEIAQRKLGDGNRWRELQKADGSQFTGQEARRLQVGMGVYLPGAKPTTATHYPVTSLSNKSDFSAQVLPVKSITRREVTASSTPSTRSTEFRASPALFSRTSQVSAQVFPTKGTTRREYPNGSSHQRRNTQSGSSSDSTNNALNLIGGLATGTGVGVLAAIKNLSPPSLSQAKDVLKLVKNGGIGKTELEARLKTSGWVEVQGRWAKKSNPNSKIGSIWTNPARDESITIRPKKGGSFGLRGYDGPSGGAVNYLRQDPKNHKWNSQGRPGEGEKPLIKENPLDIRGRTGSKPGHIYSDKVKKDAKRTHFLLKPESRGVVKALENVHLPKAVTAVTQSRVARGVRETHLKLQEARAAGVDRVARAVRESRAANTTLRAARAVRESRAANTTLRAARAVRESRAANTTLRAARAVGESRAANTTLRAARAVGESRAATVALRGASRVAAPVAGVVDTVNLYNVYQKDGFGKEFRKTAGSVAGAWGGAAAGAAIGSAIFPGVGTVVGGAIGGIAGSAWGDDIEQGAEKAGKAIADGAKNAWNKLFG